MKIYESPQNQFEKEINSIYQKSELLGWEIPSSVKHLNNMYMNSLDRFNEYDEIDKKIRLKNYLQILKASRMVFESRGKYQGK